MGLISNHVIPKRLKNCTKCFLLSSHHIRKGLDSLSYQTSLENLRESIWNELSRVINISKDNLLCNQPWINQYKPTDWHDNYDIVAKICTISQHSTKHNHNINHISCICSVTSLMRTFALNYRTRPSTASCRSQGHCTYPRIPCAQLGETPMLPSY